MTQYQFKCHRCGVVVEIEESFLWLDELSRLKIHCEACAIQVCKEALEDNAPEN